MPEKVDFLLITALEEERDAILAKLPDYQRHNPAAEDIQTYYSSELPTSFPDGLTGTYSLILLPLIGMGRVTATISTKDAIRQWEPRYTILVGIAGGIASNGVRLGDLLISDQVVDYELQKLTSDGPELRAEVYRADARMLGAARNFSRSAWLELVENQRPNENQPKRHIGPVASGDKVIASEITLAWLRQSWPKLIGVEMEAAGVAAALNQSASQSGFFMVRGVSDLADEAKNASHTLVWRQYASEIAAAYTIALLKNGPVPVQTKPEKSNKRAAPAQEGLSIPTPSIRRRFTQHDKDRFLKEAFAYIKQYFPHALQTLEEQYPEVRTDFDDVHSQEFSCKIYLHGEVKAQCRVWIGGHFRDNSICYFEGPLYSGNKSAVNEFISVEDGGTDLYLQFSNMGMYLQSSKNSNLNQEEAAELLWKRFIMPLS